MSSGASLTLTLVLHRGLLKVCTCACLCVCVRVLTQCRGCSPFEIVFRKPKSHEEEGMNPPLKT